MSTAPAQTTADEQAELRSLQLMRASLAQFETTTVDFLASLQAHQQAYTTFADASGKLHAILGAGAEGKKE